MDRRRFLVAAGAVGAVKALSMSEQADALEESMIEELEGRAIVRSRFCTFGDSPEELQAAREAGQGKLKQMGHDPRLPRMPDAPTLIDFFEKRFAPARHLLQSGAIALEAGLDEETVLACLLHDIGVFAALPKRPRVLGGAAHRALCVRASELGDSTPSSTSVLSRPGRGLRIPRVLYPLLRHGLRARALRQGSGGLRQETQVVP